MQGLFLCCSWFFSVAFFLASAALVTRLLVSSFEQGFDKTDQEYSCRDQLHDNNQCTEGQESTNQNPAGIGLARVYGKNRVSHEH